MPIRHGQSNAESRKKIGLPLLASLLCIKRSGNIGAFAVMTTKGLCLALLTLCFVSHQVAAEDNAAPLSKPSQSLSAHEGATALLTIEKAPVIAIHPKRATFKREYKSKNAQRVADWVVDSGDNSGMPFVIVDKVDARVFVFDTDGEIRGAARALLGLARGDDSSPDIGERSLSDIRPEERTTPAGRFVASLGYNYNGKDVLWVDYDLAISLHRVVTSNPVERRLQRLATPTSVDKRISFGCINVPAEFFDKVVIPAFTGTYGIVYILPETSSNGKIFSSYYDVK
jgi:hypothetical protein